MRVQRFSGSWLARNCDASSAAANEYRVGAQVGGGNGPLLQTSEYQLIDLAARGERGAAFEGGGEGTVQTGGGHGRGDR